MKRWIAFLIALSLATAQGVPPVFRLHVIADSNSEADQAIKLAVRDAIIQELGDMDGAQTSQEAEQYAAQHLEELIETANGVLEEEGFPYRATAEIGTFEFPDKTYGDVTYPAGEYDALRLVLGQGEGQNWWCVMFPPLCIVNEEILEQEEVEYTSLAWEWLQSLFGGGKKEANHAKTVS